MERKKMSNLLFRNVIKRVKSETILEFLFYTSICSFEDDYEIHRYVAKQAVDYGVGKELLVMLEEHWEKLAYPIEEYTFAMHKQDGIRKILGGKSALRKHRKSKPIAKRSPLR